MAWATGDYFSVVPKGKRFVATVHYRLRSGRSHSLHMRSYLLQRDSHICNGLSMLFGHNVVVVQTVT